MPKPLSSAKRRAALASHDRCPCGRPNTRKHRRIGVPAFEQPGVCHACGYSPPPMTSPAPHNDPQDPTALAASAAALGQATTAAHRSVLGLIAACALAIAWLGGDVEASMPRDYTYAAVGLAVATIAARSFATSRALDLRPRLFWALGSLTCAAAIALVGAAIGIQHGDKQSGLVIALAAGIFVIRPPEAIALTRRPGN